MKKKRRLQPFYFIKIEVKLNFLTFLFYTYIKQIYIFLPFFDDIPFVYVK